MYLMEFSMTPLNRGESVSPYVARILEIVDRSGLDYRLHSMGTIVEGPLDDVLTVLRDCFQAMSSDCERISCSVKFDYRRDGKGRLLSKIESVQEKVTQRLKT